jgi:hypothetical protein
VRLSARAGRCRRWAHKSPGLSCAQPSVGVPRPGSRSA